ncbi:MAG: serine hydrolase domain-containing protein, partial [Anaerolineae bacterium]
MMFLTIAGRQQRSLVIRLLLATTILCGQSVVWAQARLTVAHPGSPLDNPPDLVTFFDQVVQAQLAELKVPGAVVAVVKDGQLLFARGYGMADLESEIEVHPQTTLFRIGSITKLFTWTAVMQLQEQGLVDLDEDVNHYLDFAIPATFPEPITMRHLMTHTAGFEDHGFGLYSRDAETMHTNAEWVTAIVPARIWPVGEYSAYSNYGAALAGYIVERIAGMPYDDYIEQHILSPLAMRNTTSRQPLPKSLAEDMAIGYFLAEGQPQAGKFELVVPSPAGSMSSTAADMVRFMAAHLAHGQLDGTRILAAATADLMHARAFGHDSRLPGVAYGFGEMDGANARIIGHAGDTGLFHSLLALVPEDGLGLFVAYNGINASMAGWDLLDAFAATYYPKAGANEWTVPAGSAARLAPFAGTYRFNRAPYTTPGKFIQLFLTASISVAPDGTLSMRSPLGDYSFREVEPLYLREVGGGAEMVLSPADSSSGRSHAFISKLPLMALERLNWTELPATHFAVLNSVTLLFVSAVVAGIVGWRKERQKQTTPNPVPALTTATGLLGLLLLCTLIGLGLGSQRMAFGEPALLRIVAVLSVLFAGTVLLCTV